MKHAGAAADVLWLSDGVGSITPGAIADVAIPRDEPLRDLEAVEARAMVGEEGSVAHGRPQLRAW